MTRTSQYIQSRVDSILTTLDFFNSPSLNTTPTEKLLILLSQIDFWDYEMENLIFITTDFHKRSISWQGGFEDRARELGFSIKEKYLQKAEDSYHDRVRVDKAIAWCKSNGFSSSHLKSEKVEVPKESLNQVITLWNSLIDKMSGLLIPREYSENCGIKVKNINDFKKKKIEI